MTKKLSPRGQRRAAERSAVKLARDRVKLATLEPGGSADRPLVVDTAAVIEVHARDTRCAVCDGTLQLEDHDAVKHGEVSLRRTRSVCRECHTPRLLWFRIQPRRPS